MCARSSAIAPLCCCRSIQGSYPPRRVWLLQDRAIRYSAMYEKWSPFPAAWSLLIAATVTVFSWFMVWLGGCCSRCLLHAILGERLRSIGMWSNGDTGMWPNSDTQPGSETRDPHQAHLIRPALTLPAIIEGFLNSSQSTLSVLTLTKRLSLLTFYRAADRGNEHW